MAVVKIGVKFCGNCNPHYDMPGLVTELAAQVDGLTFGRWDKGEYDILLVLNRLRHGTRHSSAVWRTSDRSHQ